MLFVIDQSSTSHQNKSYDYETITKTGKKKQKFSRKVGEESVEAI